MTTADYKLTKTVIEGTLPADEVLTPGDGMDILKEAEEQLAKEKDTNSENEGNPMQTILIIVIAAIVVLIIVVAVMMKVKKKKDETKEV